MTCERYHTSCNDEQSSYLFLNRNNNGFHLKTFSNTHFSDHLTIAASSCSSPFMTSRPWEGQELCDGSCNTLVLAGVMMGGGVQNCPNLRDVIYGRPLICYILKASFYYSSVTIS